MSSKFQECPFCGRDELHYTQEENLWGCYRCEAKWTGPWDVDYWKSRAKKAEGERDTLKARVDELEAQQRFLVEEVAIGIELMEGSRVGCYLSWVKSLRPKLKDMKERVKICKKINVWQNERAEKAEARVRELKISCKTQERRAETAERQLEILVNLVPQEYLDQARQEAGE